MCSTTQIPAGWADVSANGVGGYIDFAELADVPTPPYYPSGYQVGYPTYNQSTYPAYQGMTPAPQANERTVTGWGGAVYEAADPQSPVVATLPPGCRVAVIRTAGSWAHVSANGVDGYMDYRQLQ